MVDFERCYITVAQEAIDFNELVVERLDANISEFGVQNEHIAGKNVSVMRGLSEMVDPFLGKSIEEIERSGSIDGLDDCLKGVVGFALGTVQSYTPTFVHMNAKLCERDFDCNFDDLIWSGMQVSEIIDVLYLRLMGHKSFIPPLPVPGFMFVESPIDVYYQTDILFFIDAARMIPEYDMKCGFGEEIGTNNKEIMMTMAGMMEIITPMTAEYGNIVNMLSGRYFYPPNYDWMVTILSLLETDKELYSEPIFFGFPEGNDNFANCMIAQSERSEPFIEKLKEMIRG